MKLLRLGLVTLLTTLAVSTLHAQAIWKWRTKDGRIEVSDRAPPVDIPESNILQRPGGARAAAVAPPGAPASSADSDDAGAAAPLATALGASRADPELEARRRKAQAEQTAQLQVKQRADQQRVASQRADNCQRARAQLAGLESGVRIARPTATGEREFLDDKGRGEELQRTRKQVAANCGAPGAAP